jgi:hypothetical protein
MATRSSATRPLLIAVAVLVLIAIGAYFVGGALEHAKSGPKIAALQSSNRLLTADVWAFRASVALDNRNFGTANDAVAKVVVNLSAVDSGAAGVDPASLTALKAEASAIKISVATDLQTQRAPLIHLANDIADLATKGG